MVGPKKQAFCPRINMLKGNFDTNYFEPLMGRLLIDERISSSSLKALEYSDQNLYYFITNLLIYSKNA